MFRYILISVLTVLHIYVFGRLVSVPFLRRFIHPNLFIGFGVALWVIFFFAILFHHGESGTLAAVLELFGMNWMAILFLLCVPLLAVDFVTGFGFLLPRYAPSLRGWALVIGVALSVIALIQGLRPPVVQNYEVRFPGISREMDGTVIVAMSDLHLGTLLGEKWLAKRVAQVQAERPDLIVLLGDLFEGHGTPQGSLIRVLSRLSAPLGVWAVSGNHEFHGGGDGNIVLMDEAGIQLLRDRWVEIRPGFVVAGVDDLTSRRRSGSNVDHVSKAFAGRPPGTTVFLSHTPWQFEKVARAGVGLMLSAHTHGGQIWPFGYIVRLFYPLLAGQYEVEGMSVIVSRGTGTWGPRMRLWRRGEILRVTLRR
ncbi:MAG: metallophosphoesterase [Deltaproteobacteria bacterium]|nr:metallophosphoesterase [Deltaproteobacteria bacterium]